MNDWERPASANQPPASDGDAPNPYAREAAVAAVPTGSPAVRDDAPRQYGGPRQDVAPRSSPWKVIKTVITGVVMAAFVVGKFFAKLKFLIVPVLKFLPLLLKTGGTMALSVVAYALMWGWWFALGFVVLILVHECGHLLVARSLGLRAGAPVFIPFMGAFIALKDAPRNAWIEALVGIGGPLLGGAAALACAGIGAQTGNGFWYALAYTGCLLNLFNLAPIGTLDGGRIVTALSPWLWVLGTIIVLVLLIREPNFLLGVILVLSLPRLFSLFRAKTDEERRYFEVTGAQRLTIAVLYFGLAAALAWGMTISHVTTPAQQAPPPASADPTI